MIETQHIHYYTHFQAHSVQNDAISHITNDKKTYNVMSVQIIAIIPIDIFVFFDTFGCLHLV